METLDDIFDVIDNVDDLYKVPIDITIWYTGTWQSVPNYVGSHHIVSKGKYKDFYPDEDCQSDFIQNSLIFRTKNKSSLFPGKSYISHAFLGDLIRSRGKVVTLSEESANRALEIFKYQYANDKDWQMEAEEFKRWSNSFFR